MNAVRLSGFLDGEYVDRDAPSVEMLLEWIRTRRATDAMLTLPGEDLRVLLTPDDNEGVSIMIQSARHVRFACSGLQFGAPRVPVEIGPHREIWPAELFLAAGTAEATLDHVVATGQEFADVSWVDAHRFPRVTSDRTPAGKQSR